MGLRRRWQELRDAFLDLLFPPRCVGCGKEGAWFCEACQHSIEYVGSPLLPQFGLTRGDEDSANPASSPLSAIHSVAYSEGALREAIHYFKYEGVTALGAPLAGMLYDHWRAYSLSADVLVPVPLHQKRLRERGYNQSLILAKQLAHHVALPVNDTALRRIRYTAPQVGLSAQQRRANVAGAFQCVSSCLEGQHVMLIDDVLTTGSTLQSCAEALKAARVRMVSALTLARAKGDS